MYMHGSREAPLCSFLYLCHLGSNWYNFRKPIGMTAEVVAQESKKQTVGKHLALSEEGKWAKDVVHVLK